MPDAASAAPGTHILVRVIGSILYGTGWLLNHGPRAGGKLLAWILSWLWSTLLPVRRKVAEENLELAFGKSLQGRRAREFLHNMVHLLFLNYLEFLELPFLEEAELISRFNWHGLEHLDEALKKGKGAFVLSAHLGAFDLLAAATAAKGYAVTIVSRTPRSELGEAIWMQYRRNANIQILPERGSLKGVLRALKNGNIVAMVLDQNMNRDRGVFVQFFGRPACTLDSLAVLALRTGAPVVPAFTWRGPEGGHQVAFQPEMALHKSGAMQADIFESTQLFTTLIEDMIRAHPEQWLWLHRRWKTRPRYSLEPSQSPVDPSPHDMA